MKRIIFSFLISGLFVSTVWAESETTTSTMSISLEEALHIAQRQSINAMAARSSMLQAYWAYRNFKAGMSPNITLSGTVPELNKSLFLYQNADGTYSINKKNYLSSIAQLNISQALPFSNGTLSFISNTQYIKQLDGLKAENYISTPISISLNQPIFSDQTMKWNRKIQPVKYQEEQKKYITAMEAVNITTINYFFDFLLAKENLDIAKQKESNAKELYRIAFGKKAIGTISENELKQLELNMLNANANVIEQEKVYTQTMCNFRNFLGYNETVELSPITPTSSPDIVLSYERIMDMARENNPLYLECQRRLYEARANIAISRAERGFKFDINATIGNMGSSNNLNQSYRNTQDAQTISLGISIPLLDWGQGRGRVAIAKAAYEIEEKQISQDKANLSNQILILAQDIKNQSQLVKIYSKANQIAQQRYKTVFEAFALGTSVSVLDIQAAQNEEDFARQSYINQVYFSWLYHYQLRYATLFDFHKNEQISYDYKAQ